MLWPKVNSKAIMINFIAKAENYNEAEFNNLLLTPIMVRYTIITANVLENK